jgi:hypothetical protein
MNLRAIVVEFDVVPTCQRFRHGTCKRPFPTPLPARFAGFARSAAARSRRVRRCKIMSVGFRSAKARPFAERKATMSKSYSLTAPNVCHLFFQAMRRRVPSGKDLPHGRRVVPRGPAARRDNRGRSARVAGNRRRLAGDVPTAGRELRCNASGKRPCWRSP